MKRLKELWSAGITYHKKKKVDTQFNIRAWREIMKIHWSKKQEENPNGIKRMHFEKAVSLADQCIPEDNKIAPKVGAVLVKNGKIIAQAYRNETGHGDHAEYILLEKTAIDRRTFRDSDLITTLEPCTENRHGPSKKPCIEWIRNNRIRKVWIGLLDENPDIRGKAVSYLRRQGIAVGWFPDSFYPKLYAQNSEFFEFIQNKDVTPSEMSLIESLKDIRNDLRTQLQPVHQLVKDELFTMAEGLTTPLYNAFNKPLILTYGLVLQDALEWTRLGYQLLNASDVWKEYTKHRKLGMPPYHLPIIAYRSSLTLNPDLVSAHIGLGRCHIRLGELPKAERQLLEAKENLDQGDIFDKADLSEAYYELAVAQGGDLMPSFLAESIRFSNGAIVSFDEKRIAEFIELGETIAKHNFIVIVKNLDEDLKTIAKTLQSIGETKMASKILSKLASLNEH